ncbi:MAG: D-sedoheptulose 7-phosphate isomerase [Thermotogaceae bacterium]|nr:D-sedoheptulose 7-phosphate isomerase [Thermotogaceae bacterium]
MSDLFILKEEVIDLKDRIFEVFKTSAEIKIKFVEKYADEIVNLVNECCERLKNGGKLILFGNGGSACDSQHIALELVGRFYKNREPIPAIALTTDGALLTEISNDIEFADVFLRQLKALGNKNDVVIGISTSGRSENVLRALKYAKNTGMLTVGFTGAKGENMKEYCDYTFIAPSEDTPRIQETHITLGHILAELIEENMF